MNVKSGTAQRTLVIAITLLVLALPVTPVTATDITDMSLTYEFNSQLLTVNVSHYSSNTKTHFVETIEIWRNGISILNRTYVNQTYSWYEYDTFDVSANVGDNLTVTATESKADYFTQWLIVTSSTATNSVTDTVTSDTTATDSTETTDGPDFPDTPANIGPVVAVGAFLVVFFIILFAWLNPDKVPDAIKQLGTRIKDGLSRLWVGIGNFIGQIRAKINSK